MQHPDFLVVRNVNADGHRVRPSNWAERLAGNAAEFVAGRLKYDARVLPCTACAGKLCLRVDRAIEQDKPHVLETIRSFMRMNNIAEYLGACPRLDVEIEAPLRAIAA